MFRIVLPLLLIAGVATAFPSVSSGQDAGVRSPLMIGTDGRQLGMGRTGVASADGASTVFWNPARLSTTQRGELSLFHTKLYADGVSYQAAFLSYPTVDAGTIGVGLQRLGSGDIDLRDDRNTALSTTSFTETNILLGYGIRFRDRWSVGSAVRLAQQSAAGLSALGVGADLAMAVEGSFRATAHRWRVGLNVQNLIEPKIQLDEESVADPINLKAGAAYLRDDAESHFSWMVTADVDQTRDAGFRYGAGLELGLNRMLYLRGGTDDSRLTAGFGVQYRGVVLDYAMIDDPDLPRNDRVSMGVRFGSSTVQRLQAREQRRADEVARQLEKRLGDREKTAYREALAEADRAFNNGQDAEGLVLYRRVLLLRPNDPQATRRVDEAGRRLANRAAQASLDAGRVAQAVTEFQAVLQRWPGDPDAGLGLDTARDRMNADADRDKQVDELLRLALSQFTSEEFAAAQQTLREMLRLAPQNLMATELRDRVSAVRKGRGDEALEEADELANREAWTAALARLDRAETLIPERGDEIDRRRAQWVQATTTASPARSAPAAVPTTPEPSAQRKQELDQEFQDGLLAFQEGNFERATAIWQIVWTEWPNHPSVGGYLVKANLFEGIRLVGEGLYAQALVRCDRVLEIDPTNAKALRYTQNIRNEQQAVDRIGEAAR